MNIKNYIAFIILGTMFFITSCNKKGKKSDKKESNQVTVISEMEFPQIPTIMTDGAARANFLINHYWDEINFNDSTVHYTDEMIEQSWVNYIDMIKRFKANDSSDIFNKLFDKIKDIDSTYFNQFIELANKYLHDPNSPIKDDEFYIAYSNALLSTNRLSDEVKSKLEYQINKLNTNKVGTKASNFTYSLSNNTENSLYNIKAKYTLVFFYNPGCQACSHALKLLTEDNNINNLVKNKVLQVLSIYPDDDLNSWKRYTKNLPKEWINGYDKSLKLTLDNLYDISSIPSLYLLDKNKIVLLRDAEAYQVIDYLKDNL